jgi:hypothetical protein
MDANYRLSGRTYLYPGAGLGGRHPFTVGTHWDLESEHITPVRGMRLRFYADDGNEKGEPDYLLFDGVADHDPTTGRWYAVIDGDRFWHESDVPPEDRPRRIRTSIIDARGWQSPKDFLSALSDVINPPEIDIPRRTGWSPDAFVDMMVWGGMGCIEPPYEIRIIGLEYAPKDVGDYISLLAETISDARKQKRDDTGEDTEVSLHICR